ncbi:MFS transporter [Rubrobacter tropicus]|uniref:MFS transporter n=1 Tax=Rubrobacter tropicus TaxID=2653851 RepID=A0A6G8QEY0_9ACTN|nr:OFA family MFS transporter [Rubrobacter tropicus]QIN84797.1 MFS transporter [Rubrobacter tropicus]
MASQTANDAGNRVIIAIAGVVMQVALGAVYAWSVFRDPLAQAYGGASATAVNTTFSITIFTLGFAAFAGGLWMGRSGPRIVALTAGVLYGLGIFLASFAEGSLVLLYLTYGLIAGAGIGLGYIVPVATLIKWFPDKRGFITGIAVAGFGGGAFVTAFVARGLVASSGPFSAFAILGIVYLVMVVGAALFMRNPPEGYRPPGWEPEESGTGGASAANYDLGGALKTWQWFALWALLFLNVTAGIAIITEAAPIAQTISGVSAAVAASLVSIISVGNALGRFFWAWLSDAIGRKWVFFVMFLLQAVLLVLLPLLGAASFVLLAILAFIVVSCYGGGFGTMPAFSADYFGSANVGKIYGLMLTAWSFGGVLGPLLISYIIDSTDSYSLAFFILAGIMVGSAVVAFIVRPPRRGSEVPAAQPEGARA